MGGLPIYANINDKIIIIEDIKTIFIVLNKELDLEIFFINILLSAKIKTPKI